VANALATVIHAMDVPAIAGVGDVLRGTAAVDRTRDGPRASPRPISEDGVIRVRREAARSWGSSRLYLADSLDRLPSLRRGPCP
jgi:hypothetical protein